MVEGVALYFDHDPLLVNAPCVSFWGLWRASGPIASKRQHSVRAALDLGRAGGSGIPEAADSPVRSPFSAASRFSMGTGITP
jgi:hypothetical protein